LLSSFISGCGWVPLDGVPESLDDGGSFVGQKSESIVKELGLPNELLSDGDKQFMVYSAKSDDEYLLVILWPAGEVDIPTLHCLRFELDTDDVVKKYRHRSVRARRKNISWGPWEYVDIDPISGCREAFWSKEELLDIEVITNFSPAWKEAVRKSDAERAERWAQKARKQKQQAEQGDTVAQLTLFKELRSQDTDQALGWLCKSADLDNQEARSIMADIYEYGGYVWVKKGAVQQDYKLAYVWHGLSGLYDQEDLQFFADRHLNSAELSEAKNMLREWRPGQCEKDLGLVSHTE